MTALDKQNPVGSGSQKLSQLLDKIEKGNESTRRDYPELAACLSVHLDNETKLVKALRRAFNFIPFGGHQAAHGALLAILGRLGGKAKSKAKTEAARRNAKLGGWPKGKKRKPR